jgi:hypothetical protein
MSKPMRKKQVEMTAAELVAGRETLGWSRDQMAEALGLLPAHLDACEAGSLPVPSETAWGVRAALVAEEQRRVLEASGLPECPQAAALQDAMDAAVDAGGVEAAEEEIDAVLAHERTCPVCRAREAYLNAHAPPLPELDAGGVNRVVAALLALPDRLPGPLRPPPGLRGEYRQVSVVMAAFLSAVALVASGTALVLQLVTGDVGTSEVLRWLATMAAVIPAYFAGGMVAGAAWDATRGIRHRFIGYVLRGGATAAAMYGAIGLVMPMIPEGTLSGSESAAGVALGPVSGVLSGVLFGALFGALFGVGKWIWDWRNAALPDPPRKRPA